MGAQPAISLRSMRFMDWVRVKGDVLKILLFHFVPKKLEQTFPAFSRCSSPIPKILFHFSKQNWNGRNPHILGAFLRLFHLFHFFINLYLREKKKEKSVYIKKFVEKNWNNWNNGVSGREPSGNLRSILPEKTGTKVEQNWNICQRAPLLSLYRDFFAYCFRSFMAGNSVRQAPDLLVCDVWYCFPSFHVV